MPRGRRLPGLQPSPSGEGSFVRHRPAARVLSVACLLVVLLSSVGAVASRAAVPDWTTYNHDGARSATDPDSGAPVSPAPAWSVQPQLDGSIWAQPLVVGSRVYVATENDTVYALDAATGAVVWKRNVGNPVPAGKLGCGDITPTVGITSTPVIDAAAGRIYAVADTYTGGVIQHRLVALGLADGAPVAGFDVPVDPPGAAPPELLNRASLVLTGGRVIVPYGGNGGDCGHYHGWLVSAAVANPSSPDARLPPFPCPPAPPVITEEPSGAVATRPRSTQPDTCSWPPATASPPAKRRPTSRNRWSSSAQLSPWSPTGRRTTGRRSTTAIPTSAPRSRCRFGRAAVPGRQGRVGRLLSATALGTTGQVFSAPICGSGAYGAALYRAGVIYVPCLGGLAALALSTSPTPSFTAVPAGARSGRGGIPTDLCRWPRVVDRARRRPHALRTRSRDRGRPFPDTIGAFNHFSTPSAGGGRLFVAAGSKLAAFQISSFPPRTETALSSSSRPSRADRSLTLTAIVSPTPDGGTVTFRPKEPAPYPDAAPCRSQPAALRRSAA